MSHDVADDRINVRGANLDLGDLPMRARREIACATLKYFNALDGAAVYIARERRQFRATIHVAAAGGGTVSGEGSGFSAHEAFDVALRKIAKQLRRRKRALDDQKPNSADSKRMAPEAVAQSG
jgi:ribosome-associated translation inhibitor RaiA